jgi:aryl-alcohol dehydrogenase-like predicted oxidoreductase
MKFKKVPQIEEEISAVGFGCWATGGSDIWNGTTDDASVATIHRAIDLGINFFDVAPVYGFGHAEIVLGEALKGRRDKVFIATKCGLVWDDQNRITNNLSPANVNREIDDSLRRLQTDHVDLYQMHWPDPGTPIEESMATLLELRAAGKIRYIGVSNFSIGLTERALDLGPIASHQGLYNMLERNPDSYHNIPLDYRTEDDILPLCRAHGMAFFPYSPLFQGLLTGAFAADGNFTVDDVRSANPKLNGERFRPYFEMAQALNSFASEIGHPLSQVAINWLINQEAVTSVICGAQTVAHIEQNAGSVDWELTPEMMARIGQILAPYSHLI